MTNVKKTLITILSIIVILAACFFCGYSIGRNKFDDRRIENDTELIRQQDNTIESIETGVGRVIDETGIIEEEIQQSTESAAVINSGLRHIEEGLQADINGISGVIERLEYYRRQGEVLEENSID